MSGEGGYALGYSDDEERRLATQARMFEGLTEDVLRHAGVGPGMHILDIGCGLGDVSFLAAWLARPNGSAMGIDRERIDRNGAPAGPGIGTRERRLGRRGHCGL